MKHDMGIFNFLAQLIFFLKTCLCTSNGIDYNSNRIKICQTLGGVAEVTGYPSIISEKYVEMVWEIVTKHDVFINFLAKNKLKIYWAERIVFLKEAFTEIVKPKFGLKLPNPFSLENYSISEQCFINDLINVTTGLYKQFGLCYNNALDNSTHARKWTRIVYENTCYKPNGKGNLPSVIYRKCDELKNYFENCFGLEGKDNITKILKKNEHDLKNSICHDSTPFKLALQNDIFKSKYFKNNINSDALVSDTVIKTNDNLESDNDYEVENASFLKKNQIDLFFSENYRFITTMCIIISIAAFMLLMYHFLFKKLFSSKVHPYKKAVIVKTRINNGNHLKNNFYDNPTIYLYQ
ncbi:putative SP-containing membrane protein [Vairimorpha necatrix]|uniref:SP-containing membrane protein n=1 Tax=Vairimorpha necatrix TaxID=6039 RepID=A0AAX4JCC3_9MICR